MKFLLPVLFVVSYSLPAQKTDSLHARQAPKKPEDKVTLSLYERLIWDTKGNIRYDENIVSNLKVNSWLRAEGGFRFGHRSQRFDSYYHYKLELQTKSFWNTVRFFARLSNDINQSAPVYARSYYIAVAEARKPVSESFSILAAWGHVLATQRDNASDAIPAFGGTRTNYNAYKIGLRYKLNTKGFIETTCGNYDVFNPYQPNNSFLQTHFEYNLSTRTSLTSNFRYQFDTSLDKPLSYFLIVGVRLHF